MGKCFTHVDATEERLVKSMRKEGLTWAQVQRITVRPMHVPASRARLQRTQL